MNKQRVLQALENVKSNPYGKWGILNVEQRNFIRDLCNSWLILDEATNKQMEDIERIKELSKVDSQQAQEIIIELKQEIERLNNIINELEKALKDNIDMCDGFIDTSISDLQELGARQNGKTYYQTILLENKIALKIFQKELDKLQELKGSDKE